MLYFHLKFLQARVFDLLRKIKREKMICIQEGCAPTNEEISRRLGITTQKLSKVLWYGREPISLNDRITWYGEDVTYQVLLLLKQNVTVSSPAFCRYQSGKLVAVLGQIL